MKTVETMRRLNLLSCFVLAICTAANAVPLNADPAALSKGFSPLYAVENNNQLYGGVSYAVFTKDSYTGNLQPQFTNDYEYVYAYQVELLHFSTVDMQSFSVDIPSGLTGVNIGYDPSKAVLEGIWTNQQSIVGNTARWDFIPNTLNPGTHSMVLVLTSNTAPVMSNADVTATGISGDITASVSTPTPEPATMILLAIGTAAVLRKRAAI